MFGITFAKHITSKFGLCLLLSKSNDNVLNNNAVLHYCIPIFIALLIIVLIALLIKKRPLTISSKEYRYRKVTHEDETAEWQSIHPINNKASVFHYLTQCLIRYCNATKRSVFRFFNKKGS